MPSDSLKNYLHLHLIVFIWGFTAILGALISLEALPLVWFRMSLAVLFIFGFIQIKKLPLHVSKKVLIQFLLAGFIIAMHWFTFFKAIKVSNISVTLACLSTGSFFTSLLEPIFYKKKVVWYEVFFGLVVVGGLCIVFQVAMNFWLGIVLALTSAFLSALFSVINSLLVKKHNATIISFYELLGGVLFLSFFLLIGNNFNSKFFVISSSDWLYLIILASVCTAYAFIASTKIMKVISPFTVMLTINLEPIYGVILAVLFFKDKEQMSFEFYIGAGIILLTVLANAMVKSKIKWKKSVTNI